MGRGPLGFTLGFGPRGYPRRPPGQGRALSTGSELHPRHQPTSNPMSSLVLCDLVSHRAPAASLRDGARATLDLRASTAPPGSVAGRPGGCPRQRAAPPQTPVTSTDAGARPDPQVTPPSPGDRVIMKSTHRNVSRALHRHDQYPAPY